MEEERLLILRMVREGKITAEEAAALLDALAEESSAPGVASTEQASDTAQETASDEAADSEDREKLEKKLEDMTEKAAAKLREKIKKISDPEVARKIEEEAGKLAGNVQRAAEQFSRVLEERIQKDIKPMLANIPSLLENIRNVGNVFSGSSVTGEEEYTGELIGDEIEVHYTGCNGNLEVKPWDSFGYRLEAKKAMKGPKSDDPKESKALDVLNEPGRLEFRVKSDIVAGVDSTLWLPRNKSYSVYLSTSNGSIRVQGFKGRVFEVHTSNGRINMCDVTGRQMYANTSNGAIECSQVTADVVELETSNDRITASLSALQSRCVTSNGEIKLQLAVRPDALAGESKHIVTTSNGAIKIALPADVVEITCVDAETSSGNVRIDVPELAVQKDGNVARNEHIVAEGVKFGSAVNRLKVVARTNNAEITVTQRDK